ncbi:MAG: 2-C-methyl-D-erythritol 4-phosphate cytidylyltransferase [Acidobacteria bacterium]|nr:2-C-methyl-D-erythritol 4-phosphate cytidylyltransferase [Acidobacteriota bacterium]
MNTAIIVAAGSGTRFGGDKPKQFLEIGGKPLLIHTLEKFENCPLINEIVLVIGSDQLFSYREIATKHRVRKVAKIVYGGKTRAESVFKGFGVIDSATAEIVAVHDGARPFVTTEEIAATVRKAQETGAACLVAPVFDTVKEVRDGRIAQTIDRANLRRALTPQAFHYDILRNALLASELTEAATDECCLVENIGFKISIVEGSPKNIKITTPEDWAIAEIYFQKG